MMFNASLAIISLIPLAWSAGVPVDAEADSAAANAGRSFFDRSRALGEWWGARGALEDRGISIAAANVFEWTAVLSGGVNRRDSSRNLLAVDLTLDLETLAGVDGASIFAQYVSVNPERGGSQDAGDIQVFSNIESDRHIDAVYEVWWEQRLLDDRLRFKIGKFDANAEFAFVDIAADFANSSAGFSPTIFGFPSYPDSAFGAALFIEPIEHFTLGYAFLDGAAAEGVPTGSRGPSSLFSSRRSDAFFHIAEASFDWRRLGSLAEGRLAFGAHLHTGRFDRFDGGVESDVAGVYATFSQRLSAGADDAGCHVFAQYGVTDEEVSDFAQHAAVGLVQVAPFGRPSDRAGVYFSFADLSDAAGAGFDRDEYVADGYYRVGLTDFLWVQPEFQFIINPSGDSSVGNALVAGVRLGVEF